MTDPSTVLAKAAANLKQLRQVHPGGMAAIQLDWWCRTLDSRVEAVLDVLISRAANAVELRQNSPFAGVLPDADRQAVLAAFAEHWRIERAA